jgi:DNA-binding transcriptional ArsR family regulator
MEIKYQAEAKFFKVLMHPARLAILQLLRNGEECVCHMEAVLGYRQAYISQHLAVMKEVGLVEGRKEGWNSYYRVIKPQVFEIIDLAVGINGNDAKANKRNLGVINSNAICACPKCTIAA